MLGPLDRIFTRIGAGDDLAGGRSTFMVEMTEAANILHNATASSLILLDEIGRGTSTFDGLSLAWAMARDIATRVRAFTLFATHYFELTTLAAEVEGCANVHLDATEHGDGIVFLHAVKDGPGQSQLRAAGGAAGRRAADGDRGGAGLPRGARGRARRARQAAGAAQAAQAELPLFAAARRRAARSCAPRSRRCNPDELTPKAALEALYRLQAAAAGLSGRRRHCSEK